MDVLRGLLANTVQGDNNLLQQATEQLGVIYTNPESVVALITLVKTEAAIPIRMAAAIGLRVALTNCWDAIQATEQANPCLTAFLEILQQENDFKVRHLVIDALQPVFRASIENWPELVQFLNTLTNPSDVSKFELFLSLLNAILEFLPLDVVAELFEVMCTHIQVALNSDSPELAVSASHLCAFVLSFVMTTPEIANVLYHHIFTVFVKALKCESAMAVEFMRDLCRIIKNSEKFADAPVLAQEFFQIILDAEIPNASKCLVASPIGKLIKQYPGEMKDVLPETIAITLHLAQQAFIDGCFEDQADLLFAVSPIDRLSRCIDSEEFFEAFWGAVQTDSVESIVAACAALTCFVEYIPETIAANFDRVFSFAMNCLVHADHCVKEAGLSVCFELVARNSEMFADVMDKICEQLAVIFESGHDPVARKALAFISELLFVTKIEDCYIERLLTMLLGCFQRYSGLQVFSMTAIAGLCESAEESIERYTDVVGHVVIQGAGLNATDHAIIKARALEALGSLIRYAPAKMEQFVGSVPGLLLECLTADDINLVGSAVLAVTALAKCESFQFDAEALLTSIINILKYNLEEQNITRETALYDSFMEAKELSLDLLTVLVKHHPAVVAPAVQVIVPLAIEHFDIPVPSVQLAAMNCAISIAAVANTAPTELVMKFIEHFEDSDKEIAMLGFRGFGLIVKHHIPMNEDIQTGLKGAIQTVFQALKVEMNCQTEDESLTLEVKDEAFDFLATVAQYAPEIFPVDSVIELATAAAKDGEKAATVELVGTLVEYYAVFSDKIPSLMKKAVHGLFWDTLPLCDTELPPHPLSGIRCVVEADPKCANIAPVLEHVAQLFPLAFERQPYYWVTMASAVSLLLSILRVCGAGAFNVAEVLPRMLAFLPRCLSESESDNIISSLVVLCQASAEFVEFCRNDVVRILAVVAGFRNSRVRHLHISEETMHAACSLLATLIGQDEQIHASLAQSLGSMAYQRLQARVAKAMT